MRKTDKRQNPSARVAHRAVHARLRAEKPKPFIGQDYTKAELIALVKKLQKTVATLYGRIEKLEGERSTWQSLPAETQRAFIADVDEGARLALHGELAPAAYVEDSSMIGPDDDEAPVFPWEKK